MLSVSIFIYNSLHEVITWDIFLRLFPIFCWVTWDWVPIFVYIRSRNFFIDVFSITIRQFLRFHKAVTWNFSFWFFSINCRISWDFLTFFINKLSDWKDSWCVSCRSFCSVHIFTNHCYSWCCSSEFRFWCEGYSSICCYCVCTNTWNCLRS